MGKSIVLAVLLGAALGSLLGGFREGLRAVGRADGWGERSPALARVRLVAERARATARSR